MFGSLRVCSILLLALAFAHADLTRADPTIDEVYREAHAGHLAKAQEMMKEVLRDHPDSAKAHYVMADLLAASGQRALAADHLATARRLAPGLPFAKPESVHELERRLGTTAESNGATASRQQSLSFGWGSGVALALALALIAFVLRRRPMPAASTPPSSSALSPASSVPATNGASAAAPASSSGSGLGSAVATGLAAGAGMVAGEALAQRLLGPEEVATTRVPDPAPAATVDNDDLGGNDFGLSDPNSWDDDDSSNDQTDDPLSGGDGWN